MMGEDPATNPPEAVCVGARGGKPAARLAPRFWAPPTASCGRKAAVRLRYRRRSTSRRLMTQRPAPHLDVGREGQRVGVRVVRPGLLRLHDLGAADVVAAYGDEGDALLAEAERLGRAWEASEAVGGAG